MPRFRLKPQEFEAWQYDPVTNPLPEMVHPWPEGDEHIEWGSCGYVANGGFPLEVYPGDWILLSGGYAGVCPKEYFYGRYEAVS